MFANKANALSLLKANFQLPRTHLHEMKNIAKTRGHRVSILSPHTLIFP